MPLLASRSFPIGEKCRLYSAGVCGGTLYGSETWPVKEKDVIRLERNDAWMVRWMCNIRPEDSISAEEFKTRLKMNSIRECLQFRRQQWFSYLEIIEESAWSSKDRTLEPSRLVLVYLGDD